jgi:plasmid replication initiation protein
VKKSKNKLTYSKSTDLIQMRGTVVRRDSLSETKRKIIALEASKVKESDTHETVYSIKAKELIDLCNVEKNGRTYDQVFTEIYELKNKAIAFINERGKISIESYMDKIELDREGGFVTYQIPEALLPHFKRYAQFTKLDLIEYMPMRGQYALLLYELLMSWRKAGKVYYIVEDLRRLLEVPDGIYPSTGDFLRRAVYAAVDQINERIKGRKIKYELKIGSRRKVEGVTFIIPKIKEELSSPKGEPTLEEQEALGQTTIFEMIKEQAATVEPDQHPAPSSVLVEMIDILKSDEEAVVLFAQYGEDYCHANIQYSRSYAKKDLGAYLRKALAGNWAKYIDQDKSKEEALKKTEALEEIQRRKLEEDSAAKEPINPDSPFAQMAKKIGMMSKGVN